MDQKEKKQDQQEQENEQDQQEQGPEHLQNTMQEFAHCSALVDAVPRQKEIAGGIASPGGAGKGAGPEGRRTPVTAS